mgnify:CR=1 FL=1|jgi:hypothetical protein
MNESDVLYIVLRNVSVIRPDDILFIGGCSKAANRLAKKLNDVSVYRVTKLENETENDRQAIILRTIK